MPLVEQKDLMVGFVGLWGKTFGGFRRRRIRLIFRNLNDRTTEQPAPSSDEASNRRTHLARRTAQGTT